MYRNYLLFLFALLSWFIFVDIAFAQNSLDADKLSNDFSVPVRILENPDGAKHTLERETKSDQHDVDDLDAQRKAADAAERSAAATEWQKIPTLVQISIAVLGTIGLIGSLVLNSRATNAAIAANAYTLKAIEQEQMNTRIQLRPYVYVSDAAIYWAEDYAAIIVEINFKNFGQTPAKKMSVWVDFAVGHIVEDKMDFGRRNDHVFSNVDDIAPTHLRNYISPNQEIGQDDRVKVSDSNLAVYVWGTVTYYDAYGSSYALEFRRVSRSLPRDVIKAKPFEAIESNAPKLRLCARGNTST
jgi:hypothetical protein